MAYFDVFNGDTDADVVLHPAALYAILERYDDPFQFMRAEPVFAMLRQSRKQDLEKASNLAPPCRRTVRAPLIHRRGARELCMQFETGGGCATAAGIAHLPCVRLPDFIHAFARAFAR